MSFPFYAIFPTQTSKKYSIVLCYQGPDPINWVKTGKWFWTMYLDVLSHCLSAGPRFQVWKKRSTSNSMLFFTVLVSQVWFLSKWPKMAQKMKKKILKKFNCKCPKWLFWPPKKSHLKRSERKSKKTGHFETIYTHREIFHPFLDMFLAIVGHWLKKPPPNIFKITLFGIGIPKLWQKGLSWRWTFFQTWDHLKGSV